MLPAPLDAAPSTPPSPSEGVTHLCGAPVVLNMLANAPGRARGSTRSVADRTAARPPPAAVIEGMERRASTSPTSMG